MFILSLNEKLEVNVYRLVILGLITNVNGKE